MAVLPGRFSRLDDFRKNGLMDDAEGLTLNIAWLDAHWGYYRDRSFLDALQELVDQREPLVMAGISLGGLGSVMWARRNPGSCRGLLLLSPFLGDEAFLAKKMAGEAASGELEAELLACWDFLAKSEIPIWLWGGEQDELLPLWRQCAQKNPRIQMRTFPGGHDWPTWQLMWRQYLTLARQGQAL
jgi:pimeloyl-ACP methyl ester carboxylesterase